MLSELLHDRVERVDSLRCLSPVSFQYLKARGYMFISAGKTQWYSPDVIEGPNSFFSRLVGNQTKMWDLLSPRELLYLSVYVPYLSYPSQPYANISSEEEPSYTRPACCSITSSTWDSSIGECFHSSVFFPFGAPD